MCFVVVVVTEGRKKTVNQNRALEFLYAAQGNFPLITDRGTWKARHFVELAIDEVQELLDQLALYESTDAELERRIESRKRSTLSNGPLVADIPGAISAYLVKRPRGELPDSSGAVSTWKQV